MPIVSDYTKVKEIYARATERGIALPVFCTEDRETLEAMMAAAVKVGRMIGVDDLPVIASWTSRYPGRSQMGLMTRSGNPVVGTRMMLGDMEAYMEEETPYSRLSVMPHLDHAYPWLDQDVMTRFCDRFASIMCDASEKPFEENIRLTAGFVERVRGRVIVEGAVDEIFEAGGTVKDEFTSPAQARRFLDETGVDIVVPNVGTEHRSTTGGARYHPEVARAVSREVGSILCLHGTSSLADDQLRDLPGDGFIKVNIFTTLAVHGGQSVARETLANVANIFDEAELRSLVADGTLGQAVLQPDYGRTVPPVRPKLAAVGTPARRDAWFDAVRDRCVDFLLALGYERFAG